MKRIYRTPTARKINYEFDLQVKADSSDGFLGNYGSKWNLDYCQMNSLTCGHFYYDTAGGMCVSDQMPFSLRR